MSFWKKVLDFLFGKDTNIFNKEGRVEHPASKNSLTHWERRFSSPEYNWRIHKGRVNKKVKEEKK